MAREKVVGENASPAPKKRRTRKSKVDPDAIGTPVDADPQAPPDLLDPNTDGDEEVPLNALRPTSFTDYVGQKAVLNSLRIAVKAALNRNEAVDHVLFNGPPGLGKTTLAHIIAKEYGSKITHTSGPTLERPLDMVGLLSNLDKGEILFIDEIHRIPRAVEEYMYSAMEDFKVDFVTGKGTYSRTLTYRLAPFTLVGATTRAGMLSAPLRDRFGMTYHLDYYTAEELSRVVTRSAGILDIETDETGAAEIARRSRGTPRIANRLLRRVRDYAEINADGTITGPVAEHALELEGVDELGLLHEICL